MADIWGWFITNYLEILATILALLSLYFQTIQNKLLWPFGIISSAIFAYIFLKTGIYADMGLQLYYIIISIYGWHCWIKMEDGIASPLQIKLVLKEQNVLFRLILFTFGLFVVLSQILTRFTDSTIPYLDAFTAALSVSATWMLTKKYIEQWLVWIMVDAIYIGIYYSKELYITILLYTIYTIMAVTGYLMWLNSFQKEKIQLLQQKTMTD